jgi:4-cresol dehydrogenase (hydroxylating) flavoprotein subunit
MHTLAQAVKVWQILIGEAYVKTQDLEAYSANTFPIERRIRAVLTPANRAQVAECMKVAQQYKFPIYPISQGKNWGFGSRVPTHEDAVIMDLSRMNKILDFDAKLGYVTIEPGVTFRQLYDFLKPHRLMVSIPGTTPDASVVANTLERGHGSGPYGDRAGSACALEVVLPTGQYFQTGLGHFEGAAAAPIQRWGVGPALDGLFMQSNLGIVTQMTVWLSPLPDFFQICYWGLNTDEGLPALLDQLQTMKLRGIPDASITLWNDYKMLAVAQPYPWKSTDTTPLPPELRERLRTVHQIYRWNGWMGLGAVSEGHRRADREFLADQLKEFADLLFFVTEDEVFPVVGDPGRLGKRNQNFKGGPFFGVPTANTVNSIYWRKKAPHVGTPDLDGDRVGKLTIHVSLPFGGEAVLVASQLAESCVTEWGFEPHIALIGITERCVDAMIFIVYDRDVEGEDDKAMGCHDELLRLFVEKGIIPTRLGIQSMEALPEPQDDYAQILKQLKQTLDPNDVLAPGRYDMRHNWD